MGPHLASLPTGVGRGAWGVGRGAWGVGVVFSIYARDMAGVHSVDVEGRYDGLTLREALPLVVAEIVAAFDPAEVIVFGSVARNDEGPDSDLDLLVVFDEVARTERRDLMVDIRRAIRTFVPVDIVVADLPELRTDRDSVGSAVYWPLREGEVMYRRLVHRVG